MAKGYLLPKQLQFSYDFDLKGVKFIERIRIFNTIQTIKTSDECSQIRVSSSHSGLHVLSRHNGYFGDILRQKYEQNRDNVGLPRQILFDRKNKSSVGIWKPLKAMELYDILCLCRLT